MIFSRSPQAAEIQLYQSVPNFPRDLTQVADKNCKITRLLEQGLPEDGDIIIKQLCFKINNYSWYIFLRENTAFRFIFSKVHLISNWTDIFFPTSFHFACVCVYNKCLMSASLYTLLHSWIGGRTLPKSGYVNKLACASCCHKSKSEIVERRRDFRRNKTESNILKNTGEYQTLQSRG